MYLSKIEMELSNPGVRAALRDAQKMHRLAAGVVGMERKAADLLFRSRTQGNRVDLYLYSNTPVASERVLPNMRLVGQRDMGDWFETMEVGQTWGFDLLTMPFRKVAVNGGGNSRRRVLRTQEERLDWLARKATQNGFSVLKVQESAAERISARHDDGKGGALYLDCYRYTGRLKIKERELFCKAVRAGIGPGKAYGLGMLLLVR